MKRIISGFIAVMLCFTTVVSAKAEDNSSVYDKELESAVISGTGTFEDPYIVDYSKTPEFTKFVNESYESAMSGEYNVTTRNTGFTGYSLDQYRGVYSNGGIWVYSSGGLSPAVDGNVKFSRITYTGSTKASQLNDVAQNQFDLLRRIVDFIVEYNPSSTQMNAAVNYAYAALGITSVRGLSAAAMAGILSSAAGYIAGVAAVTQLLLIIRTNIILSPLNSAASSGKNYVQLSFSTSYHGSWYANSSAEAGWTGNKIYTPNPGYGSGSFFPY